MTAQWHVRDSFREVDTQTWLVGGKLLLSRSPKQTATSLWTDEDDLSYSVFEITEATEIRSRALTSASELPFPLVYDVGDCHAVWKVGNAFIKIVNMTPPWDSATREHVTLAAVKAMSPSFNIPTVLYHGEWDSRYYLILSALSGQTLNTAWPVLDENSKCFYVDRVVGICNEPAQHHADYIGGVDKAHLSDLYLADNRALTHEDLLKKSLALGMDCSSTFVFFHCDLGPGNLIIAPDGSLGVIDWEIAGFVPKDWIRTKFRVGSGLDLDNESIEDPGDWRARVQRRLASEGYREFAEAYMAHLHARTVST